LNKPLCLLQYSCHIELLAAPVVPEVGNLIGLFSRQSHFAINSATNSFLGLILTSFLAPFFGCSQ
jgi:hypothetical protein